LAIGAPASPPTLDDLVVRQYWEAGARRRDAPMSGFCAISAHAGPVVRQEDLAMGFFNDMKRARTASNQIAASQGRPTTTLGRLGNIGNDMRAAADSAEWAADQQARSTQVDGPISGGVIGVATFVGQQQTGQLDGFQPVLELTLDVEADDVKPERVTTYQRVPTEGLMLMTPGRRLRVSFDPNDPRNLTIDWSATNV
jgi:hypothetical protein